MLVLMLVQILMRSLVESKHAKEVIGYVGCEHMKKIHLVSFYLEFYEVKCDNYIIYVCYFIVINCKVIRLGYISNI